MACCGAVITPESSAIDAQIKGDERATKSALKVLVLGTSASGKSTVAKQMKILHCQGFTTEELHNYKQILILNIFNGMKELVFQAENFGVKILRKNKKTSLYFANANPYTEALTNETVELAKQLWADKGIQKMWERRNEIDFPTNLEYMMANIDRFAEEHFIPTNTDVLYARQRTTGVVETHFTYAKFQWSLIDVGGQRSERRKWIHFFEGVQAVIFCAALDEFDMVCPEEPSRNKMEESLEVFEKMVNGDWFKQQPFVLFLNKSDLFKEKIGQIDLKKAFPSYKGTNTFDDAVEFIKSQYLTRVVSREEEVVVHVTCAIDTNNVDVVFKAFSETIFAKRLKYSGLMM